MRVDISRIFLALALGIAPLAGQSASAALLYNPVVNTMGNGTAALNSAAVPSSIYLYNNSVANQTSPVSSASFNNGASGTRLTDSGSATSDGTLTNNPGVSDAAAKGLSYSGTAYTYNAGYNAATGTASVASASGISRAIGVATVSGNSVSSPTVLQTQSDSVAYTANNIRGANGDDGGTGTSLFSAGTGSGTSGGWRNFNSNTILSAAPTNVRTVEMLGGQLFGTTGSGSTVGIYLLDPTGVNAATPFITTGTSSDHSPYEFALFKDPNNTNSTLGYNVAYIADDNSTNGGIEKWTYNGTTWTQAYILKDGANVYRGLAGQVDPTTGLVTLFATSAQSSANLLEQVTDTGAGASFTLLATAPTNFIYRGVALAPVPEPGTLVLGGLGFGSLCLVALRRRKQRTQS